MPSVKTLLAFSAKNSEFPLPREKPDPQKIEENVKLQQDYMSYSHAIKVVRETIRNLDREHVFLSETLAKVIQNERVRKFKDAKPPMSSFKTPEAGTSSSFVSTNTDVLHFMKQQQESFISKGNITADEFREINKTQISLHSLFQPSQEEEFDEDD